MRRTLVSFAVSLCVAVPVLAAEQSPPPPPPPPPPPSEVTEPAPAEAPPPAQPAKDLSDEGRLRWGVNGQLGWFVPQPMFTFGVEGRIGWTVNRLFAAYMQLGGGSGLYFGPSGNGSFSLSAMSQWYVGAMAELNLGDVFFIAAGPGIGRFSLAGVTVTSNNSEVSEQVRAYGGWTPSLDLKVGFTFGKRNPETGRRGGFTLALDVRAVFPLETAYVSTGTNGTQVETRKAGFGLLPMLVLGYDSH